jgi:hypothetical protein
MTDGCECDQKMSYVLGAQGVVDEVTSMDEGAGVWF